MYHVKPIHQPIGIENLPTCMYRMKVQVEDKGTSSSEVEALIQRQDNIISKLEALQKRADSLMSSTSQVSATSNDSKMLLSSVLPKDVVITCNPAICPRAIIYLLEQLASRCCMLRTSYVHSSAKSSPCVDLTKVGFQADLTGESRHDKQMIVTWIWKDCADCELLVSPVKQVKIEKEANVCRYLLRLLGDYPQDPVAATVMDGWLDTATHLTNGSNVQKSNALSQMVKILSKRKYIGGNSVSIEDVMNCSAFLRCTLSDKWANDATLKRWCDSVRSNFKL